MRPLALLKTRHLALTFWDYSTQNLDTGLIKAKGFFLQGRYFNVSFLGKLQFQCSF